MLQQLAFIFLVHLSLALGIRMAVADQLVAALRERLDDFRAVVVERSVDERADWQLERIEELEAAPYADAVAVVAPREVEDVGLGGFRPERGAEARAEIEVLDVEADAHGQPPAFRPAVVRPPRDGRVAVAPVRFQGPMHRIRAWPARRAPKATLRCRSRLPCGRSCRAAPRSGQRTGCLRTGCRRAIRRRGGRSGRSWFPRASRRLPRGSGRTSSSPTCSAPC